MSMLFIKERTEITVLLSPSYKINIKIYVETTALKGGGFIIRLIYWDDNSSPFVV
jgi:hypothetical protein